MSETLDREAQEELRRRGLEMQAALPEPSPQAREYQRRQERRSEGDNTAGEVAACGLGLGLGLWGLLLAVPYLIVRLVRRLWRWSDSVGHADPPPS